MLFPSLFIADFIGSRKQQQQSWKKVSRLAEFGQKATRIGHKKPERGRKEKKNDRHLWQPPFPRLKAASAVENNPNKSVNKNNGP
jgi:hypothetical protein